jgi:hypothetical protein
MQKGLFTLSVFALTVVALRAFGAESEQRITFQSKDVARLEVSVASSDVEVSGTTGAEAVLELKKRHWDEDCRLESKLEGGTWRVSIDGHHSSCEATLRFLVAPGAGVKYRAASGDLRVRDVSGEVEVKTGSGDIELRTLSESVRIKSGSGDIRIALTSELQKVGDRRPKLRVDTGSGDIDIDAFLKGLKGAELSISTGSGDLSIVLPKDAKVNARHTSGSGSTTNPFATTPDASFIVEARSGSGDVVLSGR